MAFNKKKKRRIFVNCQEYYWSAKGNDTCITLSIMVDIQGGQKLMCCFDYHNDEQDRENQFIITPYIVQQVIKYGLENGWTPLKKAKELKLGYLDEKIDLRLEINKAKNLNQADLNLWNDHDVSDYLDSIYPDTETKWIVLGENKNTYGFTNNSKRFVMVDDDESRTKLIIKFLKLNGGFYITSKNKFEPSGLNS